MTIANSLRARGGRFPADAGGRGTRRAQPSKVIVDATTATSPPHLAAENLVRMTRWSSSLWDLGLLSPSHTTGVDANRAHTARGLA
jgi:hypothetical protein